MRVSADCSLTSMMEAPLLSDVTTVHPELVVAETMASTLPAVSRVTTPASPIWYIACVEVNMLELILVTSTLAFVTWSPDAEVPLVWEFDCEATEMFPLEFVSEFCNTWVLTRAAAEPAPSTPTSEMIVVMRNFMLVPFIRRLPGGGSRCCAAHRTKWSSKAMPANIQDSSKSPVTMAT